jgi:hypothetical protein
MLHQGRFERKSAKTTKEDTKQEMHLQNLRHYQKGVVVVTTSNEDTMTEGTVCWLKSRR